MSGIVDKASTTTEYRAEQIRAEEAGEITLLRKWVRDYVRSHGRGGQAEIAQAAGTSRQWVSDLLSDNQAVQPRSISWARLRAIVLFVGNVPLSTLLETWIPKEEIKRAQRRRASSAPRVSGSRILEPLELEVLKAMSGLPREEVQHVIWHARAVRRALIEQPGMGVCLRCGEQAREAELERSAGLCRTCTSWVDVPDVLLPGNVEPGPASPEKRGGTSNGN